MSTLQAFENDTSLDVGMDANQYLTFILDDAEYGVDILRVQEIKGWDSVTPIPNAPLYVRGVINLRGAIVPIVDLRQRFGLPRIEYGVTTVVVVLRVLHASGSRIMGIIVDAVSDVYNVTDDGMRPPPEFGSAISTAFVKGLATVGEKMVIMLDIDRLLNSGELGLDG